MNYFSLFDLETKYDIDKSDLKKRYLKALQKFHPDRAAMGETKEYIEKSMQINEAYKILSDSYERAKYLLLENGCNFEDKALTSVLKPDELEEILDEYDLIDAVDDIEKLKIKYEDKNLAIESVTSSLKKAFASKNFTLALDYTVRLKYLTNLVKNIKLKIKHANS